MCVGDGKVLHFLVLNAILPYWCHKKERVMLCSISCQWWALSSLFANWLCFSRYEAFKLKFKQSFGKRKVKNNCVMMLEKSYYIQVLRQHSKLLHLLGLKKREDKFNVWVFICISSLSAKYKILWIYWTYMMTFRCY